jgi:hypothetical protein
MMIIHVRIFETNPLSFLYDFSKSCRPFLSEGALTKDARFFMNSNARSESCLALISLLMNEGSILARCLTKASFEEDPILEPLL